MINHIITEYEFGDVFATAEGIWDESSAMKFHAAFRAHFEDATIEFNGAQSPSLTVYKKDGTVETPELKAEYEGESDVAAMSPIWDHIIQRSNISRNASEKINL